MYLQSAGMQDVGAVHCYWHGTTLETMFNQYLNYNSMLKNYNLE